MKDTPGSSDAINKAQRKKEIDDKMKNMIREVLFYGIFLFLLLLVANGQIETNSYYQNKNLQDRLTSSLNFQVFISLLFDYILTRYSLWLVF